MKYIVTYLFIGFFAFQTYAQDIHFSNFYTNVLNVNPAFTGFFKGKYRYNITYRDQYRSVAIPYQTVSLGIDAKATNVFKSKNSFGYGILLNYDIAGDSHFNTIQVDIPLSQQFITENKKLLFSYGILPAFIFNSLNYTYLRFPEQFDGIQYNPNIDNTEEFRKSNKVFFNLGTGIQSTFKYNKNQSYTLGLAMFNITKPNISFLEDNEVILYPRYVAHGLAILSIKPDIDFIPAFKFQFQGSQKEYHFGGMLVRYFDNLSVLDISGGLWFRSRDKDAVILGLGLNYMGYTVVCNYDINISTLKAASDGRGAFEISVSNIVFDHRKKKKPTSVKCPSYL